jgi:DNA-binding IclR family transcriptional regulator
MFHFSEFNRHKRMTGLFGVLKPLSLLETVADTQHPATLAELATGMNVPKPTMHRWLASLELAGLVQRTPDGRRYELSARALQFAFSILSNKPAGAIRHEILNRVVQEVGESCNLTVLEGSQVTYIDRVESAWPLRITFQQGSKVPAYCSASGKLFLALLQPAKRDLIVNGMEFARHTGNTILDKTRLLNELKDIRRDGYALDREEYLDGLICLAVPVFQKKGRLRTCVAALAIQAPVARLSQSDMVSKLPILKNAAAALSSTLNEQAPGE